MERWRTAAQKLSATRRGNTVSCTEVEKVLKTYGKEIQLL